jgi:hypothetical protein
MTSLCWDDELHKVVAFAAVLVLHAAMIIAVAVLFWELMHVLFISASSKHRPPLFTPSLSPIFRFTSMQRVCAVAATGASDGHVAVDYRTGVFCFRVTLPSTSP